MSQYHELNFDKIIDEWASDLNDAAYQTKGKDVFQYKTDYTRIKFIDEYPQFDIKVRHANGFPRSELLYHETYRNSTDRQQMFSLKLKRETVSVARIDMSNAIVIDGKTRFRMKNLPEGVPVTAGFGSEVNFQDIGFHEMKESLSWTVETQVKVPQYSGIKASVTVTEKTQESHFKINTLLRGNVHCDAINQRTGVYRSLDGNIVNILQDYAKDTPGLTFTDKHAKFESRGYCSFRFGVEKHVFLDEVDEEDEEDN